MFNRILHLSILALLAMLLLAACSARQIYSGLQEHERSRCVRGPQVEYEECMARQEMDYREYRELSRVPGESLPPG